MWNAGKWYGFASVFFGIIAVITSIVFFIGFPAAILAMFFGGLAVKRYYRKSGTTAIVLGITSIVITIVVFVNVVNALNVSSLVIGNWIVGDKEYLQINENETYIWYNNKDNLTDNYTQGNYSFSSGLYKAKNKYVMGYTISFKQEVMCEEGKRLNDLYEYKYLIYQDETDGNRYEMMNMQTGQIRITEKQKNDLWWWIF